MANIGFSWPSLFDNKKYETSKIVRQSKLVVNGGYFEFMDGNAERFG
jgi:hypothetical protein